MDNRLARLIDEHTPQLTRELADGVAVHQLKHVVSDLDFLWKSASDSFVPGLTYHGIRHCTPPEIYQKMTASRKNSRRVFEVSLSHTFMVKILLKYEGEPLPDYYLWLPAPQDGGYLTLRGSQFALSPILNDIVFSAANENTIFMRLPRTKFNFERLQFVFSHNEKSGEDSLPEREIVNVVHGKIHQSKEKPILNAKTTLVHYLFGRYGFEGAFKKLLGFVPVIGYVGDKGDPSSLTVDNYPSSEWVICSTSGLKPKACPKNNYRSTTLRLAVPKEHWNPSTKNMIAGFFYIVDHFPDRLNKQWILYNKQPERIWRILLGQLTYQAGRGEEIIHDKIIEHYNSLNHYIDTQAKEKLSSIGLGHINDFYELLWYILENFDEKLLHFSRTLNSMYDKELNVNDFVMQDINNAIFLSVFNLTQRLNTKKVLTMKDIVSILDRYLRPDLIFGINKPSHGEVNTQPIPNDNKALRLTAILVPQSANDSKRNKKLNLLDPAIRYHPSIAEVGGYTVLPKSNPDGRRRLNTCVLIDKNYKVVRREEFRELLDDVEKLTQRNTGV